MNVIFYNRDFSGKLPLPKDLRFEVNTYSNNQIGGPDRASLRAAPTADRFDLRKLLRCPIVIEGTDGRVKWFGFVNRVNIPNGTAQRVGIGLDNFSSYVVVAYADGDTSAASNSASITEYGQKEIRLSNNNATQAQAEQLRDLYLGGHQEPPMEFEFSGGSDEVTLECYGWLSTLGWQYYTNTSSSNVENTTQITAIVTASGQFFAGTVIEDVSNFSTNENRDGRSTALTYILGHLNEGTDSVLPLLARVDQARYLHVYERAAKPPTENVKYVMDRDGRLETDLGVRVPDEDCTHAVWCRLKEFSDFPPFFIERASYDARQDKTTYTPADAFEPVRQARWVASVIAGGNDGTSGSTYYPPYFPTEQHTHIMPRLHRVDDSGQSVTSVSWIEIATAPTRNLTYNGLNYFNPTTFSSSRDGWEILVAGIYDIEVEFYINCGAVTEGRIGLSIGDMTSGLSNTVLASFVHSIVVTSGGAAGYVSGVVKITRKLPTVGNYLVVLVTNGTDLSSVTVGHIEMVATLERATG